MEEKRNEPASAMEAATESPSPAADPPSSRRRGGGLKRKAATHNGGNAANSNPSSSSKRQAREKPLPVPLFSPMHNGPLTRARLQPNSASALDNFPALEVLPAPVTESGVGATVKTEEEDWEALEARIEADYDAIKSRGVRVHVVPNHCGWFSWTKVHQLEEQSLASFFNGKSDNRTPDIYLEIRNSIMNQYRSNPSTPIEVKDLEELSVGDLDARQEVMEFLDYWGLINYHPFPETKATNLASDADEATEVELSLHALYRFEVEDSYELVAPKINVANSNILSRLLPESLLGEESVAPEGPSVEYHCNSCSADCSRKRYHCQKQADFDLCTECFNGRKFDSDMSPSDFILMEPAEVAGASGGKWTDQETLLLLEALELFSENWNEIAEHVATKTKAQCILHFIQMPIEDAFLDCLEETDETYIKENSEPVATTSGVSDRTDAPEKTESKGGASENQPSSSPIEIQLPEEASKPIVSQEVGEDFVSKALREAFEAVDSFPSAEEKLSFANAGNPVIAMVAFLRQLVEPNIVTASAHTSLKSISTDGSGLQLAARHCFILGDPLSNSKTSTNTEKGGLETKVDCEEICGKKNENLSSVFENNISLSVEGGGAGNGLATDSLNEGSVTEEKDHLGSSGKDSTSEVKHSGDSSEKSQGVTEVDLSVTKEKVEDSLLSKSNNLELENYRPPSCSGKGGGDSGDVAPVVEPSQPAEAPKDVEMTSDSLPSEKTECHDNGANSEATDRENESKDSTDPKNEVDVHNLKRAATTAISAAAVKAKLLVDEEEDQIRLLAASLIEKQLHKLETKLALFNDMDIVVARVRDQLERSKQRLYHERAQIIAARLGMSASASRPMAPPQQVPNRVAMTFPNAVMRPPITNPLRLPISRPATAPPATVGGSNAVLNSN